MVLALTLSSSSNSSLVSRSTMDFAFSRTALVEVCTCLTAVDAIIVAVIAVERPELVDFVLESGQDAGWAVF